MTYVRCLATRKDGRPCQGLGTIFDPQRNGMVCDAHTILTPEVLEHNPRLKARVEGEII
jgi:hypothetical protein